MTEPSAASEAWEASAVRVQFHDPLSMQYRTLVIGPDHKHSGAEHDTCDDLAAVCPELDSAYCSTCGWQARISGAWYVDMTQAVWHGYSGVIPHDEAWRIPTEDGTDYGVLVRVPSVARNAHHWYLICPATATLYLAERDGSFDLTDCCDGEACDFLDDTHAKAHLLVRHLDLIGGSEPGADSLRRPEE